MTLVPSSSSPSHGFAKVRHVLLMSSTVIDLITLEKKKEKRKMGGDASAPSPTAPSPSPSTNDTAPPPADFAAFIAAAINEAAAIQGLFVPGIIPSVGFSTTTPPEPPANLRQRCEQAVARARSADTKEEKIVAYDTMQLLLHSNFKKTVATYMDESDALHMLMEADDLDDGDEVLAMAWLWTVADMRVAANKQLRAKFNGLGFLGKLISILRHPELANSHVVVNASLQLLGKMIYEDKDIMRRVRDADITKDLVTILRKWFKFPDVVAYVCRLLIQLIRDAVTREALGEAGLCELIVDVMREWKQVQNLIEGAGQVFVVLEMDHDANRARFRACGGHEAYMTIRLAEDGFQFNISSCGGLIPI